MVFGNTRGWGDEFDKMYLSETVVPKTPWFPEDVDGWLSEFEGVELARLGEGKDVLEIGSYCGRSTICLAQKAKSVLIVDPFDGRATPAPGDTFEKLLANLDRYGVIDRVMALTGTSEEILPDREERFDLIFIDGDHSREAVERDIELSLSLLRPGGLLVFHDYHNPTDPGVTAAVDELLYDGVELLGRFDSLAVVRPPATVASLVEN